MDPVKVTFALTWKDYYHANKLWLSSTRYLKYVRVLLMLIIVGCGAFIIWSNVHYLRCNFEDYSLSAWLVWFLDRNAIGIALIIAGLILFSGWFNRFAYWLHLRNRKTVTVMRTWEFTEDGAKCYYESAESVIKWNYFGSFAENKDYFILVHDRRLYYPFPKRVFSDPAALEQVIALARKNVPSGKV